MRVSGLCIAHSAGVNHVGRVCIVKVGGAIPAVVVCLGHGVFSGVNLGSGGLFEYRILVVVYCGVRHFVDGGWPGGNSAFVAPLVGDSVGAVFCFGTGIVVENAIGVGGVARHECLCHSASGFSVGATGVDLGMFMGCAGQWRRWVVVGKFLARQRIDNAFAMVL